MVAALSVVARLDVTIQAVAVARATLVITAHAHRIGTVMQHADAATAAVVRRTVVEDLAVTSGSAADADTDGFRDAGDRVVDHLTRAAVLARVLRAQACGWLVRVAQASRRAANVVRVAIAHS